MITEEKPAVEETQSLTILNEFKSLEIYKYDVIERAAEAIEAEVMSEVIDVTTTKGRDREKSLAFKVSQAKSRVVKMANASIEDAKATVKAVTSERIRLESRFDGIRDKRKEASIEWEVEEHNRCEKHRSAIARIKLIGSDVYNLDTEEIDTYIAEVRSFDSANLQEYADEGEIIAAGALKALVQRKEEIETQSAKDAELKKLQDEAEKRKIEDEERQAAEEEKAEEDRIKAHYHKLEADRAVQAELDKVIADQKIHDDKIAFELAEEQRKIDEDARIAQAKIDAIQETEDRLAKIAKDLAAIDKENADRAEADRLAKENAELKRKADKKHQANIVSEVQAFLVDYMKLNEIQAEGITYALEQGKIPHVSIEF